MEKYCHHLIALSASLGLSLIATSVLAAKPVNLRYQPVSFLQSLSALPTLHGASVQSNIKELNSHVDFNGMTHLRVQQTYAGYPVWGGDAVIHIPQGEKNTLTSVMNHNQQATMNGIMYQNLRADLPTGPAYLFSAAQADKALQQAIQLYQKNTGLKAEILQPQKELMVYVDKADKAHWAFFISFRMNRSHDIPVMPTFIMDAATFSIYKQWDNIQTVESIKGGGIGGNPKMGKLFYDNLTGHFPALDMQRIPRTQICSAKNKDCNPNLLVCYLENKDVTVRDAREISDGFNPVLQFECKFKNSGHNYVFWNVTNDEANGGYSPANDALYAGKVIREMYQKWYGVPVLTVNKKPMVLSMIVHADMENAFWDGAEMVFGDGESSFYPLVSLGIASHEISHGFTEQHSNLKYEAQSGGLNEAFSDMAAQAAEFYSSHHNSWQIGPEVSKDNSALRYMDEPTKDCGGRRPGNFCSISNVSDYRDSINVHYTSGVFNKIFYLIGTAKGWDTKNAFNIMVHANASYWTATTTFAEAACGVIKATKDYKYDLTAVTNAIKAVGIDASKC